MNRHGFLALRVFWRGMRSWEGTRLRDTPENRRLVEAQALIINAEMKAGTFDYLRQFPTGNKAPAVVETEQAAAKPPQTIGEYYRFGSSGKNRPSFARAWRAIIATTSRATFSQSSKRHHGLNSRRRCSTPSARTCSARKICSQELPQHHQREFSRLLSRRPENRSSPGAPGEQSFCRSQLAADADERSRSVL